MIVELWVHFTAKDVASKDHPVTIERRIAATIPNDPRGHVSIFGPVQFASVKACKRAIPKQPKLPAGQAYVCRRISP